MAAHSSVLAWRIPGPGAPGGLPSTGSYRVGSDLVVAAVTDRVFEGLIGNDFIQEIHYMK